MGRQFIRHAGRMISILGLAAFVYTLIAASATEKAEKRLRLIPLLNDERLEDIAESPDGTRLMTHDRGYAPRLWDPRSMRMLAVLTGPTDETVSRADMSKDGQFVITLASDVVRVWETKTAHMVAEWWMLDRKDVGTKWTEFCLSPDNKKILVSTINADVFVMDVTKDSQPVKMGTHTLKAAFDLKDISVSPDSKFAATCGDKDEIIVWDIGEKKFLKKLNGFPSGAAWVEYSIDGKQLLVSGLNGQATLWNAETGVKQFSFEHVMGTKGTMPLTLMSALFVGKNLENVLVAGPTGTMTIYDRQTGKEVRKLVGYKHKLREIRRSAVGTHVATYEDSTVDEGYDQLKIWDTETGKEYPFTRGHFFPTAGEFSPDGRYFWVGYADGSLRRHELATGNIRTETVTAVTQMTHLQILPTTNQLLIGTGKEGGLGGNGNVVKTVVDPNNISRSLEYFGGGLDFDVSPSGDLVADDGYIKDENGETKKIKAVFKVGTKKPLWGFWDDCEYTNWGGGEHILAWDNNKVHLFNLATPEHVKQLFSTTKDVYRAFLSPKNDYCAVHTEDGLTVISVADPTQVRQFPKCSAVFWDDVVFSPDGKLLSFYSNPGKNESVVTIEVATGRQVFEFPLPIDGEGELAQPRREGLSYSPDGTILLLDGQDVDTLVDALTGKIKFEIKQETGIAHNPTKVGFSPDSKYYLQAEWREVNVYEVATGNLVAQVQTQGFALYAKVSSDGRRLLVIDKLDQLGIYDFTQVVASNDPTVPGTYARLGSMVFMEDGSWLVIDREGRYDSSSPSDVKGASYILEWEGGLEPIDVGQMKPHFYEPGLFGKLMGVDKNPARSVPDLSSLKLFPGIEVQAVKNKPLSFEVSLNERDGGGIGVTRISINGKEVETRKSSGFFVFEAANFRQFFLPAARLPQGQGNTIEFTVTNSRGDLESRAISVDIGIPADLKTPEINFYGLFVGVGDYVGNKRDLNAPPSDAQKLAEAVWKTGEKLLPQRVHISTMTTGGLVQPSRTEILKWFDETSKKATSSDIVMVFFSGHGTSKIGEESGYFFLTADADPSEVTPAILGRATVSGEDLQRELKKIAAGKQIVVLDTCHSGAASQELIGMDRATGSDYARAYEAIKDSTGTWLLAGSAADQLSYESTNVEHGMLTYSLLEGIDQASPNALREGSDGDMFVDVDRWFSYAANRVEALKNEVGVPGIQRPEFKRKNQGTSFDIGVVSKGARGLVGLKPPKPIVILGNFEDENDEDPIKLEDALQLETASIDRLKVWTGVQKHPNVYRVAGSYKTDGDKVTVRVNLQRYDALSVRTTLESVEVVGSSRDVKELAKKLAAEIQKRLIEIDANRRQR